MCIQSSLYFSKLFKILLHITHNIYHFLVETVLDIFMSKVSCAVGPHVGHCVDDDDHVRPEDHLVQQLAHCDSILNKSIENYYNIEKSIKRSNFDEYH